MGEVEEVDYKSRRKVLFGVLCRAVEREREANSLPFTP
jgi:hypothetical protein